MSKQGTLRPVAYVIRRLRDAEGRWSTSEIKLLSVVYDGTYSGPFLYGRCFTFCNYHASLQYLKTFKTHV